MSTSGRHGEPKNCTENHGKSSTLNATDTVLRTPAGREATTREYPCMIDSIKPLDRMKTVLEELDCIRESLKELDNIRDAVKELDSLKENVRLVQQELDEWKPIKAAFIGLTRHIDDLKADHVIKEDFDIVCGKFSGMEKRLCVHEQDSLAVALAEAVSSCV